MSTEPDDIEAAAALREAWPLSPEARVRLRARVREEARRVRVGLAEASLHAGFALGAVVWAVAAVWG
jgi:hypothetical protein